MASTLVAITNQFDDDLADLVHQHKSKAKPRFPSLRRMQRKKTGLKLVDSESRPPEGADGILNA